MSLTLIRRRDMESIDRQKQQAMEEYSPRMAHVLFLSALILFLCILFSLPAWDQDLSLLLSGLQADCCWVTDRRAIFFFCNLILIFLIVNDSGLKVSFVQEGESGPREQFSARENSHWRREELSLVVVDRRPMPDPAVTKGGKAEEALVATTAEKGEDEQEENQHRPLQQQEPQYQQIQQAEEQEQERNQKQEEQGKEEEREEEEKEEQEQKVEDELEKKCEKFIEKIKKKRYLEHLQAKRL